MSLKQHFIEKNWGLWGDRGRQAEIDEEFTG